MAKRADYTSETKKRDYMTPEKIEKHLSGLETYHGKVGYIQQVLKRGKFLSPQTKEILNNKLQNLYQKAETSKEASQFLDNQKSVGGYFNTRLEPKEEEYKFVKRDYDPIDTYDRMLLNRIIKSESKKAQEALESGNLEEAKQKYEQVILSYEHLGKGVKAQQIRNKLKEKYKEKKNKTLEGIIKLLNKPLMSISIITLITGFLFQSFSLTGNVIGNISTKTLSLTGVTLLIIGLLTGLIYLKLKD